MSRASQSFANSMDNERPSTTAATTVATSATIGGEILSANSDCSAPAQQVVTQTRSFSHRQSRVKSLSRRSKHQSGVEFSNRHQTNKMVKELCHVISCFRQLVACLGSCSDCWQLRSDISSRRMLICHLIKVIRATLAAHTTKWVMYKEHDRQELINISNIYCGCMNSFIQDLRRCVDLYTLFVMTGANHTPPADLINTGVSSYHASAVSELDRSQLECDVTQAVSCVCSCIRDMETICAEVKNFPWNNTTWSASQASNGVHHTVPIEEDDEGFDPNLVTSRRLIVGLLSAIAIVVVIVLSYTAISSLS